MNLEELTPGDRWQDRLAMFRLTGDRKHLEAAMADAGYDVQLIPFDGGHAVVDGLAVSNILDAIGS